LKRATSIIAERRAFTLVEMLTVVVIVALLLAMVVPGFTKIWEERKVAQAETLLHGILSSARGQALRHAERGLFFFLDPVTGQQMIVPIAADPPNSDPGSHEYTVDCAAPPVITDCISDAMAENRFFVIEGDMFGLPIPMRVVPRAVVELDKNGKALWSDADLAVESCNQAPTGGWPAKYPRQRNTFAVIFGPDGKLQVNRTVVIHDSALTLLSATQKLGYGYRTRLPTSDPTEYYLNVPNATDTAKLDATGSRKLYDILVERDAGGQPTTKALNFPSVDGLLIYDDSALAGIPYQQATDTFKRTYLMENARPLYISRLTGDVLEGPKGENE
jgi:prepilin-type N-terminal cleavage/methylation domain-containing protein